MKLSVLVNSTEALKILNESRSLSGATAYKIAKNVKKIEEELKSYQEGKNVIINKYCSKDDKGENIILNGNYDIPNETMDAFNNDLLDLLDTESDIEIRLLSVSEVENASLSPAHFALLDFLIDAE